MFFTKRSFSQIHQDYKLQVQMAEAEKSKDWKRYLFFVITLILGGGCLPFVFKMEQNLVTQYLQNYPEAYHPIHSLRPYLLALACILPALGSLLYACSGIIDRYLAKKFLASFFTCLGGFVLIWLLLDLQDNLPDFGGVKGNGPLIIKYYLIQIPYILVLMSPFVLLLSSLFVLGQLSTHKELISIIQTGRGLFRVVAPLICIGVFFSLLLGILNFHWAAWGEAYKDGLKDIAKHRSLTLAKDTIAYEQASNRLWFIGLCPHNYFEGAPLKNIEITVLDDNKSPQKRFRIEQARWSAKSGDWAFTGVQELEFKSGEIPEFKDRIESMTVKGWPETPSKLISPGLEPDSLGIPELEDWLQVYKDTSWANQQPYITQWHARISKPVGCLVAVLLATPLGIVFSRRGAFGGVVTAIILCVLLFFSHEILLVMGEGGYLTPWVAAWGANIFFAITGLLLLVRRVQNRPIYQSLKSLFGLLGGKA